MVLPRFLPSHPTLPSCKPQQESSTVQLSADAQHIYLLGSIRGCSLPSALLSLPCLSISIQTGGYIILQGSTRAAKESENPLLLKNSTINQRVGQRKDGNGHVKARPVSQAVRRYATLNHGGSFGCQSLIASKNKEGMTFSKYYLVITCFDLQIPISFICVYISFEETHSFNKYLLRLTTCQELF